MAGNNLDDGKGTMNGFGRTVIFSPMITALCVLSLVLPACTVTKIIPVQLARVTQTETYNQYLEVNPPASLQTKLRNKRDAEIVELDKMLTALLGGENWQILKDIYGSAEVVDAFRAKRIKIKGQLSTTIYIEPVRHEQILVEGFGRFFVLLDDKTILLSGDSRVVPKLYSLEDFKNGIIKLESKFYVTRIPKRTSTYHEAKLESHIKVNNDFQNENLYALNYGEIHDMYLVMEPVRDEKELKKIGYLKFDATHAGSKLIDLSGMTFLKEYDEAVVYKVEHSKSKSQ